ncbi:hypothetical protein H8E88_29565 [candidate division KSB1 bacterium]|nr:hypothetical protein [candidate division KSB1 bacterium]MBL7095106.1 hypothetical protein [candidate division KSB1 bacterium]
MKAVKIFLVLIFIFNFTEINAQQNSQAETLFPKKEILHLRCTNLVSNESYDYKKTMVDTVDGEIPLFLITTKYANSTAILKAQKPGFAPLHFSKMDSVGNVVKMISYSKDRALFVDYKNKNEQSIKINKDTYNKSALTYLFRKALFFEKRKEINFNLIMETDHWGLQRIKMYAKIVGEENIATQNGFSPCFKIQLGVAGMIGELFWRNKYYYYFLKDKPHYFVKYSEPEKEKIELLD